MEDNSIISQYFFNLDILTVILCDLQIADLLCSFTVYTNVLLVHQWFLAATQKRLFHVCQETEACKLFLLCLLFMNCFSLWWIRAIEVLNHCHRLHVQTLHLVKSLPVVLLLVPHVVVQEVTGNLSPKTQQECWKQFGFWFTETRISGYWSVSIFRRTASECSADVAHLKRKHWFSAAQSFCFLKKIMSFLIMSVPNSVFPNCGQCQMFQALCFVHYWPVTIKAFEHFNTFSLNKLMVLQDWW